MVCILPWLISTNQTCLSLCFLFYFFYSHSLTLAVAMETQGGKKRIIIILKKRKTDDWHAQWHPCVISGHWGHVVHSTGRETDRWRESDRDRQDWGGGLDRGRMPEECVTTDWSVIWSTPGTTHTDTHNGRVTKRRVSLWLHCGFLC